MGEDSSRYTTDLSKALAVINRMKADGVIDKYAIGGAIGAMFYTEPSATYDLDVFISSRFNLAKLKEILARHGLAEKWKQYNASFGNDL